MALDTAKKLEAEMLLEVVSHLSKCCPYFIQVLWKGSLTISKAPFVVGWRGHQREFFIRPRNLPQGLSKVVPKFQREETAKLRPEILRSLETSGQEILVILVEGCLSNCIPDAENHVGRRGSQKEPVQDIFCPGLCLQLHRDDGLEATISDFSAGRHGLLGIGSGGP